MSDRYRKTLTKKWSDPWFFGLSPLARYLFDYFISNDHVNTAGISELSDAQILMETGLGKDEFPGLMNEISEKVVRRGNWTWVKNFVKHQATNDDYRRKAERDAFESPFFEEFVAYHRASQTFNPPSTPIQPPTNGGGAGNSRLTVEEQNRTEEEEREARFSSQPQAAETARRASGSKIKTAEQLQEEFMKSWDEHKADYERKYPNHDLALARELMAAWIAENVVKARKKTSWHLFAQSWLNRDRPPPGSSRAVDNSRRGYVDPESSGRYSNLF